MKAVKIFFFFLLRLPLSFLYAETVEIFPQGYYESWNWEWYKPIEDRWYTFKDVNTKMIEGWITSPYYLGLKDCFYIPSPIDIDEIDTEIVSKGYVRIDRSSVSLNENGFKEFILNGKTCPCIDGGGFFAADLPYMYEDVAAVYDEDYTEFMLDGKKYVYSKDHKEIELDVCCRLYRNYYLSQKKKGIFKFDYKGPYPDFVEHYSFMRNIVKSVKLSVPCLEEDINGKHIVYDDEMLFLRWFLYYSRINRQDVVNFINCTKPMVEGDAGNGTGISYDIEFYIPASNLIVLNGYADWNKQSLYKKNARMKKVKVEGDGFSITYDFEDFVHFSRIDFPKEVSRVKLIVLEVYDGSRWSDLAVSGFWVNTKKPDPRDEGNYEYVEMAEESIQRREREKKK